MEETDALLPKAALTAGEPLPKILNEEEVVESKLVLNVKTLQEKPFHVEISDSTSVEELTAIISEKANAVGKYLRLIHQGKLLDDSSALVTDYKVRNNAYIHVAISDQPPRPRKPKHEGSGPESRTDADDGEEDANSPPRGFDTLRSQGLSRQEIQALRLHFYPDISNLLDTEPQREGESSEARIYRIEEEWMARQGPHSEFAANLPHHPTGAAARSDIAIDIPLDMQTLEPLEGTYTDMMWGVLMGVILGFILLFWLWERSLPRKQKIGILVGVMINLTLGAMRRSIV